MDEEKFWELAGLMLSGEATLDECAQLEAFLLQRPELRQRFESLCSIWNKKGETLQAESERAFSRHMQRLSNSQADPVLRYEGAVEMALPEKRKFSIRRSMVFASAIAASLLVCLVILYPNRQRKDASIPRNTVSTKPGSRTKIQLPDGTQVWLNADSKLEYNDKFSGGTRSVHLSGEAYFDVVKDKEHPFIIHTSTIDIKVLGTAFNVRSYQNEKSTETALFRGSVEIIAHNNPERKIVLKPLEKLVLQNSQPPDFKAGGSLNTGDDKPLMSINKVHLQLKDSAATDILWTKNKLSFDSETLEDVARKIERWFAVKVTISDERLRNKLYTAVFDDESLAQVMEALRITGSFEYTIEKKEVTIKP